MHRLRGLHPHQTNVRKKLYPGSRTVYYPVIGEHLLILGFPIRLIRFRMGQYVTERRQEVEFAALVGIGGASLALGAPNMCNGANLAYTRAAFLAVQGFSGNAHVASGDDEFLMHKIAARYPGQVAFLKAPAAIVSTAAQESVGAFLAQRVRWASKWPHYQNRRIKQLALLVFGVNALLFLGAAGAVPGWLAGGQIALLYAVKLAVDGWFLAPVLRFFNRRHHLLYLLPWQLVYVPYVVGTALAGLRGTYSWKGRRVS